MRAWSGPQINPLTKCQQVLAKSPLVLAGVAEGNSHNNVPAVAGAYTPSNIGVIPPRWTVDVIDTVPPPHICPPPR